MIRAIREVSQDLSPASCFRVSKQGFFLSATSDSLTLTDSTSAVVWSIPLTGDLIDVVRELQLKQVDDADLQISFEDSYVGDEPASSILPFGSKSTDTGVKLTRGYYFSDLRIQQYMLDFLSTKTNHRLGYQESETVEWYLNYTSYDENQQMILWVSFWLIDTRRMHLQTASFLRGEIEETGGEGKLVNTLSKVEMNIGDTFKVTEMEEHDGQAAADITNLWGDRYSYLAKLQIYIRNRLEKLFGDYSLRDNQVISAKAYSEKNWAPYSYVDTNGLSKISRDILLPGT